MRCRVCNEGGANDTGYHQNCFLGRFSRVHGIDEALRMWVIACGEAKERKEDEERHKRWADTETRKEDQNRRYDWQNGKSFEDFFGGMYTNFKRGQQEWFKTSKATKEPEVGVSLKVSKSMLRKLMMLCHPDKHGNSEMSSDVTRFLIKHNKEFG